MFIQPQQMLKQLGISNRSTVLDIGCGSGYYILEACKICGVHSKYIAIDKNKDLLKRVKDSAIIGGYIIDTLVQDIEKKIILPDYVADYIILSNVLHLIDNKDDLAKECYRLLTPKGKLLFVDWKENNLINNIKSVNDNVITLAIFYKNGFRVVKELPAGQYHYAYILQRD